MEIYVKKYLSIFSLLCFNHDFIKYIYPYRSLKTQQLMTLDIRSYVE